MCGPAAIPTLDKLAQDGLRDTNFHTTALCSPTRVAPNSGRDHQQVKMALVTEMASGFPGATGQVPSTIAPPYLHDGYAQVELPNVPSYAFMTAMTE
jgi:arylsulfatase A-like enzyme